MSDITKEIISAENLELNTSVIGLLADFDIVLILVFIILLVMSFFSWAVAIEKLFRTYLLNSHIKKFELDFWSGNFSLDELYDKANKNNIYPVTSVFVTAINEWRMQTPSMQQIDSAKTRLKDRIYDLMIVARNKAMFSIKSNIRLLANIAVVAPFVGLFGTVWGVIHSLNSIFILQNTAFASIAPGVAEALLATAMGLFVAIPALFFYNFLTGKINQYEDQIDNFSIEFANFLVRELDK